MGGREGGRKEREEGKKKESFPHSRSNTSDSLFWGNWGQKICVETRSVHDPRKDRQLHTTAPKNSASLKHHEWRRRCGGSVGRSKGVRGTEKCRH